MQNIQASQPQKPQAQARMRPTAPPDAAGQETAGVCQKGAAAGDAFAALLTGAASGEPAQQGAVPPTAAQQTPAQQTKDPENPPAAAEAAMAQPVGPVAALAAGVVPLILWQAAPAQMEAGATLKTASVTGAAKGAMAATNPAGGDAAALSPETPGEHATPPSELAGAKPAATAMAAHAALAQFTPDLGLLPAAAPSQAHAGLGASLAPDSAASPPTGAAVRLDSVPLAISAQVQEGMRRFEIRLDPAELGRVDIRLDVDADGTVRAHLIVERPGALQHLQQDAPRLEQALASAGTALEPGGLSFSLKQDHPGAATHDGRQNVAGTGEPSAETKAMLPAPRRLAVSTHLDLFA